MPSGLKQFGAKATASFNQLLHRSRLTLALMYVVILAVILLSAGSITRYVFTQRLEARIASYTESLEHPNEWMRQPPLRQLVRQDLLQTIFWVNGFLLVAVGCLSYWLAGITMRPVAESYRRQKRFLADASHELRTPLAILQTSLENEAHQTEDKQRKHAIQSDLEEVQRMGELVNNLLLLSRMGEEQERVPARSLVSVNRLLEKSFERFKEFGAAHQVVLDVTYLQDDCVVWANEELLVQALGNVVKNAIVYNKPSGTVTLSTICRVNRVMIHVEDTGIGIALEDQKKVFDRFYRVDKSRSRQTGGSGLGLSIVQSIVASYDGSVFLTSVPEQGTTVTIVLPIHRAS